MKRKDFLKLLAAAPLAACTMKLNELSGITDQLPKTDKMPAFFIGHGSPTNAIEDNPFTQSLTALGKSLSKYERPNSGYPGCAKAKHHHGGDKNDKAE